MPTREKKLPSILVCVFVITLIPTSSYAGGIEAGDGRYCAFKRVVKENSTYFYGDDLTCNHVVLTFRSPTCMKDTDANRKKINELVSKPYSHADANFQTIPRYTKKRAALQVEGYCIQSLKYSLIGVAIDYVVEGGYITSVIHCSAGTCEKRLPNDSFSAQGKPPKIVQKDAGEPDLLVPGLANIDPLKLQMGWSYRLSKETPLTPDPDPSKVLSALAEAKRIGAGGVIEVLSRKTVRNTLWYYVRVQTKDSIIGGWINSTALMGQDIRRVSK